MARKMRYEWNMSKEKISSASHSIPKDITPMFKSRLEADGLEPSVADDIARSFSSAMQAGYMIEITKMP